MNQQLELPAIREPLIYLKPGSTGFFSLLFRYPERMKQETYPIKQVGTILRYIPRDNDTYITPNQYIRRNRRLVNLWQINAVFSDLDTYKISDLDGLSPEHLAFRCLDACQDQGIPIPSLILFSGRGLQVKWLLDRPLPRQALPRWNALQRVVTEKLLNMGADKASIDGSRVLRLEMTINSKTGLVTRVLWPENWHSPVTYDFELLCKEILPYPREIVLPIHKDPLKIKSAWRDLERKIRFTGQSLNWARLEDIRKLAFLRGWTHGNPDGNRDPFIFGGTVFTSWVARGLSLFQESQALTHEFAPGWDRAKLLNKVGHYFRYVETGRRFRFTNQKLIDLFEITPQEERSLKTIISKSEKQFRDREDQERKRRASGALTREEYEAKAQMRRLKALGLRQKGLSYRQIGEELGITQMGAFKLLNRV